ncbi:MAG: hypothetical protein D6743_01845 [Calditrichaeota bacterium]|nr:MAG: hypothetical protein D6743_01845 [Calditrichota bacterium]
MSAPGRKTIAIPVFGARVASRFDCSENLLLVVAENGTVKKKERIKLFQRHPQEKIAALARLGVDVLICGGISDMNVTRLGQRNIDVIPWMQGNAEEILERFLAQRLAPNRMKGRNGHRPSF